MPGDTCITSNHVPDRYWGSKDPQPLGLALEELSSQGVERCIVINTINVVRNAVKMQAATL